MDGNFYRNNSIVLWFWFIDSLLSPLPLSLSLSIVDDAESDCWVKMWGNNKSYIESWTSRFVRKNHFMLSEEWARTVEKLWNVIKIPEYINCFLIFQLNFVKFHVYPFFSQKELESLDPWNFCKSWTHLCRQTMVQTPLEYGDKYRLRSIRYHAISVPYTWEHIRNISVSQIATFLTQTHQGTYKIATYYIWITGQRNTQISALHGTEKFLSLVFLHRNFRSRCNEENDVKRISYKNKWQKRVRAPSTMVNKILYNGNRACSLNQISFTSIRMFVCRTI